MKSTLTRITLISFLFVLFIPNITAGETKTFIKEYTYQASEYDSKVNCRTLAFQQVQRLLLEELGTYIESHTEVKNFQLTKDQITALTGGIVKTSILAEKWDGERYWMQAKIEADPNDVSNKVDNLRKDHQKTREFEALKRQVDESLKEIENLKKEKADSAKIALYKENIQEIEANALMKEACALALTNTVNDLKKAIELSTKAIQLYSKTNYKVFAYFYRGGFYLQLHDYDQAIKDCTKAIELDPKDALSYSLRGLSYTLSGNYKQAIQDFSMAINLNPKLEQAYLGRGMSYGRMGKHEQAIMDMNRAIDLDPRSAEAYYSRGGAYFLSGKYARAIENYDKAISLNSKTEKYFVDRGYAYFRLGKHQQAIIDFNAAIALNPKDSLTYTARGVSYRLLGKPHKALTDFDRAIKLDPRLPINYHFRGSIYLQLGYYDRAIRDFTKAIKIDPKYIEAYKYRGEAYKIIGNNAKAKSDYKTVKRLEQQTAQDYEALNLTEIIEESADNLKKELPNIATPDTSNIKVQPPLNTNGRNLKSVNWFNKGIEFEKSRDYQEAIEAFTKAIELNPKYTQAYLHRSEAYKKLNKSSWNAHDDINKASELDAKATWEWLQEGFH